MLSSRIAEIRQQRKLSQADVALILNITQSAYSSYETGRRQMNFETLCKLADYYAVSTDYLLGRADAIPSFLTEGERAMIDKFRKLDTRAKATVENYLRFEQYRTGTPG